MVLCNKEGTPVGVLVSCQISYQDGFNGRPALVQALSFNEAKEWFEKQHRYCIGQVSCQEVAWDQLEEDEVMSVICLCLNSFATGAP